MASNKRRRVRLSNSKSQYGEVVDGIRHQEYQYLYGDGVKKLEKQIDEKEKERSVMDRSETDDSITSPTNKKFLPGVDNRSYRARHMKASYDIIVADLGGHDNISFAESEIARKCAAMSVLSQEMERAMVMSDDEIWDFDTYMILARTQTQLLKTLGMKRKSKDVGGGSLDSYLNKKKDYKDYKS